MLFYIRQNKYEFYTNLSISFRYIKADRHFDFVDLPRLRLFSWIYMTNQKIKFDVTLKVDNNYLNCTIPT